MKVSQLDHKFRPGAADEESRRVPPDTAVRVGCYFQQQLGWQRGSNLAPIGAGFFCFFKVCRI
ncbi:MAG: hypothetical protein PHQ46_03730 [Negativicutes bacterium]|nr:hypothetical protein [Negativicutes bacterium]